MENESTCKLLSICTAAYNAEKFIDKMLLSILKSKYSNKIEIIIVNDGSKDNTLSILRKYEENYPGIIIVVDKENGGSGSARNRAFQLATGKYLKIIDADDWVVTAGFNRFMEKLSIVDADMILNNYFEVDINRPEHLIEKKKFVTLIEKIYNLNSDFPYKSILFPLPMHGITYRSSVIKNNDIRLSEGISYVDMEYITLPIPYTNSVAYIEEPFYVYQWGIAGQSVDKKVSSRKNNQRWRILKRLIEEFIYAKDNGVSINKLRIIENNMMWLAQHYFFVYFNTLSFIHRKEIKTVDEELKYSCMEVYNKLNQYKSIRFLRHTNYYGYYFLVLNYLLRNNKYIKEK